VSKSQQKRRFVNRHLPFSGNYFAEGKNPACRRARPLRAAPPGGRNLEAALDRGHVGHLLLAVVSQAVSPVDAGPTGRRPRQSPTRTHLPFFTVIITRAR
jgi:hypothetical protein